MKKMTAYILTMAIIAAMLAGCEIKAEGTASLEQEITDAPVYSEAITAEVLPALNLDSVVLREEGTVPGSIDAQYRLPKLDADAPVTEQFNKWVDAIFRSWKYDLQWHSLENRSILEYMVFSERDILTVEFWVNGRESYFSSFSEGYPSEVPGSFCIDLHTKELLNIDGILERTGATREMLEDFIRRDQREKNFAYEDQEFGEIRDVEVFRDQMLSSDSLQNISVRMPIRYGGEFQLGILCNYYVDDSTGEAIAVEQDRRAMNFTYLYGMNDILGAPEVRSADAWVADGDAGTLKGEYLAEYIRPCLVSDEIDRGAFEAWELACFEEWKENVLTVYSDTPEELDRTLGYRAYVIGNVLTVMLTNEGGRNSMIWHQNPAASFDLTTGNQLGIQDILEITGISQDHLDTVIRNALNSYWETQRSENVDVAGMEACKEATLSKENLKKTEFTIWAGRDEQYALRSPGEVTVRIWIPYQILNINGIPTAEESFGYWHGEIWVPGMILR